ncbi:MAG: transposase [Candidatus Omnitrophica bacterium]|nr:transposase [Candidatus Omnitrophota bacterium]
MPRLPRIYIKEAVQFITCRGEHNETLFKDKEDYNMFLELMRKYQEQFGIKVFAFCLMPDHLHLLVEIEKPIPESNSSQDVFERDSDLAIPQRSQAISDFMHALNNNYTKYYNSRYQRKGHLFRERFKSALIEKSTSLLKMTAYLHLNPQRSGLTNDATTYPYSSYQMYLYDQIATSQDLSFMRQAVSEALSLLNNRNYSDFIKELTPEEGQIIHKKLQRGGILGSEDFIRKVKEAIAAYEKQGQVQKLEIEDKKNARLYLTVGAVVIILLAGTSGIFFIALRRPSQAPVSSQNLPTQQSISETQPIDPIAALRFSEWEIELIPFAGTGQSRDIITFYDNKFFSAKMNSLGLPYSNYSVTQKEDGVVVWETMQSDETGSASWHGEIKEGKMSGILNLQETGKEPQVFSFTSINSRRTK